MRRWAITLSVAGFPIAALLWLWWHLRAAPVPEPVDEILAYELSANLRSVSLRLPGGIDEVLITTWKVEPTDAGAPDPTRRIPYSFDIVALDSEGQRRFAHHVEVDSRVTPPDEATGEYEARLADSDAPVTDGRTQSILLRGALPRGGTARIETTLAAGESLLVRAAYREPRGTLEEDNYERGLSDDDRRRIVQGRAALGFDDLMPATRRRALSTWGRRLDAVGREDVDFRVRRLLFGDLRATMTSAPGAQEGFDVGPRHFAAFNFGGPVHLQVRTAPGTDLRARFGEASSSSIHVSDSGTVDLDDPVATPHTLVLEGVGGPEVRAHLLVPAREPRIQIGDRVALARGNGLAEIEPDLRRLRFLRLDPDAPVVTHPAAEQTCLRILVRAVVGADQEEVSGNVVARWQESGGPRQATIPIALAVSKFERWRPGADATDSASATLAFPAGTSAIELVGSPDLAVALFAEDVDTPTDLLAFPYRVPLREDETWRNAPYDLRHWVRIRPWNADELETQGRAWDLMAQVRIEPVGLGRVTAAGELPERPLQPTGDVLTRHFMESAVESSGTPFPLDAWTRLGPSSSVTVDEHGPRARRLTVMYVAEDAELGGAAKVKVDRQVLATRPLMMTSGTLDVAMAQGRHEVSVDGLGADGIAFVDAQPRAGAEIFRRRVLFEITPDRDLVFRFPQPPGRPVTLVVLAASDPGESPMFRYVIDGGNPKRRLGSFFHVATLPSGTVEAADPGGKGFFWEGAETTLPSVALHKAKIRIGDDLAGQDRELRLRCLLPTRRAWVRVVLVGEPPQESSDTRIWTREGD